MTDRRRVARRGAAGCLVAICAGALYPGVAFAREAVPSELQDVTVIEQLGNKAPADAVFTDHAGRTVRLGELFDGQRPVLLTLNYFTCATLCTLQLNGLLGGLEGQDNPVGADFRVVTISIDPNETVELSAAKRDTYLTSLGQPDADWTFLTGDKEQIDAVAGAVGFEYRFDPATEQFAHPAVYTVLSPDGTVARYLYGFEVAPRDLRFATLEAAAGRLGSPVEKLILSCFQYDRLAGRYTPQAFGVMRLGGIATVLGLGGFGLAMWRRERSHGRSRSTS